MSRNNNSPPTEADFSNDDDEHEYQDTYKVTNKKSLQEYAKLDAEDESLTKWKESLGLNTGKILPLEYPSDKRQVVIKKIELVVSTDPRKPILFDLTNDETIEKLSKTKHKIKEGSVFNLRITFKIQHEIITGLRYVQYIKKAGIPIDKIDDQLGSYAPNTVNKQEYIVTLPEVEAPTGFLARGSYSAVSKFIDDDKVNHLTLNWGVEIVKG
ncbi:probable Rho GDP-dissociation inhibitor [Saccharomycodes ludwigii]|uniref:Probable Rho GDP-dissociation inhibitor n=1 Tax=Saccharomycodes ludwigii TaxID=36035 RepID=A0A376B3L1_9ASCO|nr:hypothetical protein SCDLUD_000282 [Saccharomycodes ludwigii]KAH3902698.1 hypothetical protein SCDLUD_000282 [Saccharomycodes ludwigii]SSD59202.1 probable Rho GDP-dissociation inhibitor [Saccharomycodes ludwigii]